MQVFPTLQHSNTPIFHMKPFITWLIIAGVVFGGMSGAYHLYLSSNPRLVLVAVDSSFSMKSAWPRVDDKLEGLTGQRYTNFSLVTEKNKIHGWSESLSLGKVVPYAPRDFAKLADSSAYSELDEADEKYLITNSEGAKESSLTGWTVIQLAP